MSRQQTERSIPHLRDIFSLQQQGQGGWGSSSRAEEDVARKLQHMRLSSRQHADQSASSCSAGNDSAVSVGSASEDEHTPKSSSTSTSSPSKKKKQRSSRRDNSRTLTERDVKHLERHLSMKKTIRKKIMRDLQQAFVEDPSEFRVDGLPPEQLKADINIQSLSFGAPQKTSTPEASFLDMLRGGGGNHGDYDDDSGHGSPTRGSGDYVDDEERQTGKKTSFWRRLALKGRGKR